MRIFPHCDARIVHAPGVCDVCDEHAADLQEIRVAWGIAFTGEDPLDGRLPCPAEHARGRESVNYWGGNTPKKGQEVGTDWAGYQVTEADPRIERDGDGFRWAEWFRRFLARAR